MEYVKVIHEILDKRHDRAQRLSGINEQPEYLIVDHETMFIIREGHTSEGGYYDSYTETFAGLKIAIRSLISEQLMQPNKDKPLTYLIEVR